MKGRQSLRIIGGQWRGRRLSFPDLPGLRPTADRVRETAFNWLQFYIPGSRCLDLFAGSGAMGLEAASRGAERVVLVDRAQQAYQSLVQNRDLLDAAMVEIVSADALNFLKGKSDPFDVVFLDPPFDSSIIGTCCKLLAEGEWLAPRAYVYLELDKATPLPELPADWELLRSRQAGRVGFHLLQRQQEHTGGHAP